MFREVPGLWKIHDKDILGRVLNLVFQMNIHLQPIWVYLDVHWGTKVWIEECASTVRAPLDFLTLVWVVPQTAGTSTFGGACYLPFFDWFPWYFRGH